MSRAITLKDVEGVLDKAVQQILAMAKVPFSKADEVAPISLLDDFSGWSINPATIPSPSWRSDYALSMPMPDVLLGLGTFAPLAREIPLGIETFIPQEFRVPTPKKGTSPGPVSIPTSKTADPPTPNRAPIQKEQTDTRPSRKDLENLLAAFKESGMGVREVKSLPSGATRITFEEFFGMRQERQPEFVRARGR